MMQKTVSKTVYGRMSPYPTVLVMVTTKYKLREYKVLKGTEQTLWLYLNEITVQCEGVRSQCVTFHFSVYIFRYTE